MMYSISKRLKLQSRIWCWNSDSYKATGVRLRQRLCRLAWPKSFRCRCDRVGESEASDVRLSTEDQSRTPSFAQNRQETASTMATRRYTDLFVNVRPKKNYSFSLSTCCKDEIRLVTLVGFKMQVLSAQTSRLLNTFSTSDNVKPNGKSKKGFYLQAAWVFTYKGSLFT